MATLWGKKQEPDDVNWTAWLADEKPANIPTTSVDGVTPRQPSARPARTLSREELHRERIRTAGIARPTSPATPPVMKPADDKKVSVNIELKKPDLKSLKQVKTQLMTVRTNKRTRLIAVGILSLIVIAGALQATKLWRKPSPSGASEGLSALKPLVPEDNPQILSSDDTNKVAYDAEQQVLSYSDEFLDKTVTVSQQPIPDQFKNDADPASAVAKKLGTPESVKTAYGNAYIVTAGEGGGQTVILSYRGKLVFITSQTKKDADSWKFYVESLRPS